MLNDSSNKQSISRRKIIFIFKKVLKIKIKVTKIRKGIKYYF